MPSSGSTTQRRPLLPGRSASSSPDDRVAGPRGGQAIADQPLGVLVDLGHEVGRRALGADGHGLAVRRHELLAGLARDVAREREPLVGVRHCFGELDEVVERLRVGERVAARRLVGLLPHQDALDGHLEHLARQRARHLGDLLHLARHVARRAVLAHAPADRGDQVVVELGAVVEHDEQRHPVLLTGLRDVDHERIDHLRHGEHRAVDLARAHADAAAVDRRVRAAGDDGGAALGDADPVAVAPDAGIGVEVGLLQPRAVLVAPEASPAWTASAGSGPARPPPRSPRCRRASNACRSAPSERACSSPRCTGSTGQPPTNAVHTSVPPEVENSQVSRPTCS